MWQAGMAVVDFTNPAASKWYNSHLERLAEMGVDSFKTDFAERIPVKGVQYYNGADPERMHNYYALLYSSRNRRPSEPGTPVHLVRNCARRGDPGCVRRGC
jgi:alpha-glucosidase (family GH31 glycosyl hydrolase)